MSKLNINFDFKALAKALVENRQAGISEVTRHKGFLDLIAKSQGYVNFKALTAHHTSLEDLSGESGLRQQRASAPAGLVVPKSKGVAASLRQLVNGHWFEFDASLELQTLQLTVQEDHLANTTRPRQEYLKQGENFYHVIRHPKSGEIAFALSSFDDYERACTAQAEYIDGASYFEINNEFVCPYGPDGDWFAEVENAFDELSFSQFHGEQDPEFGNFEMSNRLEDCPFWSIEGTSPEGQRHELYINALDWLFARVDDTARALALGSKGLRIQALR